MRDIVVLSIVFLAGIAALRRPWIGVMLWTWLSIMNPHRYTWGIAFDAPVAAFAVATTAVGFLMTKDRTWPFKDAPAVLLAIFMAWMTISWLLGLDPQGDYEQWKKVMKIDVMILLALALLRTRAHAVTLAWVVAGSLALLGVKGGLFTAISGGGFRVWGPAGTFIEDNNAFAIALIAIIPLLRFLQLQVTAQWVKLGLTGAMVTCALSVLGSQSRGALLAIGAMALLLWWRSKNRFFGAIAMVLVGVALIVFMPDSWSDRMSTITEYETDGSAMGRISAWWNCWNIAWHYPFGVGFETARPELFARFSPYPTLMQGPHSIYFLVLGNHGFIGLFLFLAIWITTWRTASWLRREAIHIPQARWCADLAALSQVGLVGYFVGGAFLPLSYFDLPYNILVLILVAKQWVLNHGWQTEPATDSRWLVLLGIARPAPVETEIPHPGASLTH